MAKPIATSNNTANGLPTAAYAADEKIRDCGYLLLRCEDVAKKTEH